MDENVQSDEPKRIQSIQLKRTLITPHMEESISPGKNLIYCSSFQIAWNELQDDIIKEEVRLAGAPLMAELLNKQLSTKSDLSEESYVAMAGKLSSELLKRISMALKKKFQEQAPPKLQVDGFDSTPQFLAYAYLYLNLKFATEFESLTEPCNFRSTEGITKVRAFGIHGTGFGPKNSRLRAQVDVIDCPPWSVKPGEPYDLIVRLRCSSIDEEIILAIVEAEESLVKTIETTMKRVRPASPAGISGLDSLCIPKLDFNLEHTFTELTHRNFENEGWEKWFISEALQWIRFRLNEKGALLKSEARLRGMMGMPRRHVFDQPFLLYLKRKDAKYPYFAMWVDNDELMLKA